MQKNISINVFGIHTSNENTKNSYYVLIKEFNRFMTNKAKHHGYTRFCQDCLQCFSSSRILESHKEHSLAINYRKSILLPREGTFEVLKGYQKYHL